MTNIAFADTTALRSHRHGESLDSYLNRLARARLKKSERTEIDTLYQTLDAECTAAGLPPAKRVP